MATNDHATDSGREQQAEELLKDHPDQESVAAVSLVAQNDVPPTELSINEWKDGIRKADIAVEFDHPSSKVAWAVWDDDELALFWSNGNVERTGVESAIMMMAEASDCGVAVIPRREVDFDAE
jgi:hypothetical protein